MNGQNPTCTNCHQVIVAEDGDTCASIPTWQRGRFEYCDQAPTTTVPRLASVFSESIGPREVGGVYRSGYWGDTYTVEAISIPTDGSYWGMRVRWSDGHTTVHSTSWDARCDAVVCQPNAVPDRAPAGMLAVRVGTDPWTVVPLE